MPFNVNSSPAHAADPNHAADGAPPSTGTHAPRGGAWSYIRRPMAAYVGFNLNVLSQGIEAFSSPHDASESPVDRNALINSIFAQATHRISGQQEALQAELHRMNGLLNATSSQAGGFVAPQSGPQAGSQTGPQAGPQGWTQPGPQGWTQPGPQTGPQAGPQAGPRPSSQQTPRPGAHHAPHAANAHPARNDHDHQQRYATHMRRTLQQQGEDNALSLLGGHGASGGHGHNDHHTAPTNGREAELREENRLLRELLEAQMGRPPSRS